MEDNIQNLLLQGFEKSLSTNLKGQVTTSWNETDRIEFKKSLQTVSETISKAYLPTISGFANNKGGVIIYGIDPISRELVGIKEVFEDLDNRYASTTLGEGLDGTFEFLLFTARFGEKLIGFLWVRASPSKPVILKVQVDNQSEGTAKIGEIYFRYPAQTKRILAADLRTIINDEIANRMQKLVSHINKITQIGVDNSAILDKITGEISSTQNDKVKLVLSKEILDELNLIDEAKVVETDGAPAYIIKGTVEVEETQLIEKEKKVGIRETDIYSCFFSNICEHPIEFIYEILVKTTHHYPIYFFIHSSGLSKDQIIDIIDKRPDKDIKASTKQKIIEKLSSGTIIVQPSYKIWRMPSIEINLESDIYTQIEDIKRDHNIKVSKRDRSIIRTYLFQQLINRAEINEIILDNFFCELVEAISCGLEQPDLDMAYTCRLLDRIYNHVNMKGNIKSVFRKLICIIDEKLYGPLAPRLSNP